ncbi:MAG: hypothetical protein M3R63_10070 [Actinomycetota bacterium]|nr:hypothetical protein [Actinomycetota bacterium]
MDREEILSALSAVGADLRHRIGEDDDIELLAGRLGFTRPDQVLDLVERVADRRLLTPQVELFVRSVLDSSDR